MKAFSTFNIWKIFVFLIGITNYSLYTDIKTAKMLSLFSKSIPICIWVLARVIRINVLPPNKKTYLRFMKTIPMGTITFSVAVALDRMKKIRSKPIIYFCIFLPERPTAVSGTTAVFRWRRMPDKRRSAPYSLARLPSHFAFPKRYGLVLLRSSPW